MLTVKGLVKIYTSSRRKGKNIQQEVGVRNLDLEAKAGEFITLLGPSGCGKSTTLKCIAGVETPDKGEICIGNKLVFSAESRVNIPPERRNVGMVPQSYALWPHLNVFENIAFPLRIRKWNEHEIKKAVKEVLEIVGLSGSEEKTPLQLSGGQQQRVALCRAIVYKPDVLLLDEPLSNLDAKLRVSMRMFLKDLQKKLGITTVYVTHDQTEAFFLSDRLYVLMHGQCLQSGSVQDVIENPKESVAEFLGYEFAEGVVKKVYNGSVIVEVDSLGQLVVKSKEEVRVGECITVGIKVGRIGVSEKIEDKINTFEGRITQSLLTSPLAETWVKIKEKEIKLFTRDRLPENTRIYINIPPEACVVYRKINH